MLMTNVESLKKTVMLKTANKNQIIPLLFIRRLCMWKVR